MTEVVSIYNSGIPKDIYKNFTIESNKPSIYYRFEKEHLGIHDWNGVYNGPSYRVVASVANAAYAINNDLDRPQLDVRTADVC